jgi:hypothetical protein
MTCNPVIMDYIAEHFPFQPCLRHTWTSRDIGSLDRLMLAEDEFVEQLGDA